MEYIAFHDRHFNSIQALRGITALFIVLEHVRFLNCGAFGVDVFFCVSGFMIMFSTHKDTAHFLTKRLIRILPLYYSMTLFTFLLLLVFPEMFSVSSANPVFLVKSLLFIPFDIGGGVIQPLMRIGWTVNCEIFFYLLFGLSLRISHKYRGLLCGVLLAGVVLAAQIFPDTSVILSFYGNPVMLEFILGILCYYAAWGLHSLRQRGRLPRLCLPLSVLAVAGIYLGLLCTKPFVNTLGFRRPLVWGLPAVGLVLAFFLLEYYVTMPAALIKLGDISFSLYLLHYYPVTFLDRKIFDFGSCTPLSLAGVAVALGISVTLALICHTLIEKRFSGWLRQKLLSQNPKNPKK